jgi:hypothetical protein
MDGWRVGGRMTLVVESVGKMRCGEVRVRVGGRD